MAVSADLREVVDQKPGSVVVADTITDTPLASYAIPATAGTGVAVNVALDPTRPNFVYQAGKGALVGPGLDPGRPAALRRDAARPDSPRPISTITPGGRVVDLTAPLHQLIAGTGTPSYMQWSAAGQRLRLGRDSHRQGRARDLEPRHAPHRTPAHRRAGRMHAREHARVREHQLGKLEPRVRRHRAPRPDRVGVPDHDAVVGSRRHAQQPRMDANPGSSRRTTGSTSPTSRSATTPTRSSTSAATPRASPTRAPASCASTARASSNGNEVVRVLDLARRAHDGDHRLRRRHQPHRHGHRQAPPDPHEQQHRRRRRRQRTARQPRSGVQPRRQLLRRVAERHAASSSGTSTPANPSPSSTAAPQCTTRQFLHGVQRESRPLHQVDQRPSHPRHGRQLRRPRRLRHRHRRADRSTPRHATHTVHAATWSLRPADWTRAACTLVGRDLTTTEWNTYIGAAVPYHRTCTPLLPDTHRP